MTLANKVALVTGGARGIGAATAIALRDRGASVAVLDRESRDGTGSLEVRCDITSEEDVAAAIKRVTDEIGAIDILVNNAGINANFDAVMMTTDDWKSVFDTDLRGAWLCARAVLPTMVERGRGSIVNVSSVHARATIEGFFPYGAAKAALEGMTRSLALDYGPNGIRVNSVAPGYTRTALVEQWLRELAQGDTAPGRIEQALALRRIAEPEEVAAAICFLASDDASAITGTTLTVDCGLTARFAS